MDKILKKAGEFLDLAQTKIILEKYNHKGSPWVKFDFQQILLFSPELADSLLDNAQETIETFEDLLENGCCAKKKVRIYNLPSSTIKTIWGIRNTDFKKLISVKGTISKISSVFQKCCGVTYTCTQCGHKIFFPISGQTIPKPSYCKSCANKSQFVLSDQEFYDYIKIGIIDDLFDPENKKRTMTRELICIFEKDMASTKIDVLLLAGKKAIVSGYLKNVEKNKFESAIFKSELMVNYITFPKVGWDNITIDKKTEKKIIKLSKEKDIVERLANSVVDIAGEFYPRLACIHLLAGAPTIYNQNGLLDLRGTIHINLVGDPGSAKSQIAKAFGSISPIYSYQTCATASGKGLVASVVKDSDMGNWTIYPGVVPMANQGVVVIDELDKLSKEDYGDHNNAMNDMRVPIAKANVKGVLEAETCYLATCNPEFRVWNLDGKNYFEQIDMPPDFLDRFDLIFPIVTATEPDKQVPIMDIMLDRYTETKKNWNPEFDHDFIRKYIAYCRQKNPRPKMNKKHFVYIKEQMLKLMKPKEGKAHRVSFRHLESVIRFSFSNAILRLTDVCKENLDMGLKLKQESLKSLKIISEEGELIFENIQGEETTKRSVYNTVRDIIFEELESSKDPVETQLIVEKCKEKGIKEYEVDDIIEKMLFKGTDIMQPKNGFIKLQG